MQLRRSTFAALMFTALIVGWLLPLPTPTAQEQSLADDFEIPSAAWVEQIETRVDRNAAILQAILFNMDASASADFRQALSRVADEDALPDGVREQARDAFGRTGR